MHREELKQTLVNQFEPMNDAVQKKLAYLQSDDVFADYDENAYSQYSSSENMSVEDAFTAFVDNRVDNKNEETPRALNNGAYKPVSSIKVEQATAETIQSHKQNIAAKIAALRGISSPGDYLDKKW
ncbi:MAG: hypothetical protein IJ778_02825 [Alphaproteobacteria bacterium]|nr:hypothetical protein [Alphaproteobacteria bacterium]